MASRHRGKVVIIWEEKDSWGSGVRGFGGGAGTPDKVVRRMEVPVGGRMWGSGFDGAWVKTVGRFRWGSY